ncbi:hypothetical protein E1B28_013103 [Marasmius oreades]|uniref:Uncharacterized protein n=1 Tax=Marasmius oreades TaxID=181124 RepID=A0A9P7ULM4_9AGAR|nr:uncharacterized protein E1B28_013103 [Marasmius oreades]KAG7087122.1 hypothetical protein E1B28_013103 [Marasmius oreades]
MLQALNLTLVPTMIPAITSDFNQFNEASWLGTAYLLATCTFTPLYGRLCNVLGRRRAFHSAIWNICLRYIEQHEDANRIAILVRYGWLFTASAIITSDMYTVRSRGYMQSIAGVFYGVNMPTFSHSPPVTGTLVASGWNGTRGSCWRFHYRQAWMALCFPISGLFVRRVAFIDIYQPLVRNAGSDAREIFKRIDYGGSFTLLGFVGSTLALVSLHYNDGRAWGDSTVLIALSLLSFFFLVLFLVVEMYVALEPILPSYFLAKKIPLLVGVSNALVAVTNLSVTYFFPMWFQTVMLTSASTAGLHLLPSTVSISTGSIFAGWMMMKQGRYKMINLIFGILPFFATILLTQLKEDSNQAHLWLNIMPFGFGNAVVLQTMYVALVANLPDSRMVIGTGAAQLLRGLAAFDARLGQVAGLAISSAVFQSRLDTEIRERIRPRDSYAASLYLLSLLARPFWLMRRGYPSRINLWKTERLHNQSPRTGRTV